uniref:Uncharacterized protein n=1 Tax=Medicago truncatula TaxID=3880 RepID=I3SYE4_MEDTR|nr:unknown [Medicago truncatula]
MRMIYFKNLVNAPLFSDLFSDSDIRTNDFVSTSLNDGPWSGEGVGGGGRMW